MSPCLVAFHVAAQAMGCLLPILKGVADGHIDNGFSLVQLAGSCALLALSGFWFLLGKRTPVPLAPASWACRESYH